VPFALTLAFSSYITLWYLHVSDRLPVLASVRFELVAAVGLLVVTALRGLTLKSPLTPFVAALFLCLAIQVPLSVNPALSWNVFLDRVLKFATVGVLIASLVKAPSHLRWFLGAFLLAMLKLGQEGFLGIITGSLLWENQGILRLHGPTPMYEHPNSFAGMAIGSLPFALYLLPAANRWQKAALVTLAAFAVMIVVFTGSRTGYVAAAGFLMVVVVRSRRIVLGATLAAVATVMLLTFVPDEYKGRFESIFTQEDKEGHSTDMRKEILRDAWEIFLQRPFGVGVGAFPTVRWNTFRRTQDTHNLYLEVGTNLGVQGLAAFMAVVAALLLGFRRIVALVDAQTARLGHVQLTSADAPLLQQHLADLTLLRQTAIATQAFVIVRLILGLFGMDLYEIYWWFAAGLFVALHHLQIRAAARSEAFVRRAGPEHQLMSPPTGLVPPRTRNLRSAHGSKVVTASPPIAARALARPDGNRR